MGVHDFREVIQARFAIPFFGGDTGPKGRMLYGGAWVGGRHTSTLSIIRTGNMSYTQIIAGFAGNIGTYGGSVPRDDQDHYGRRQLGAG